MSRQQAVQVAAVKTSGEAIHAPGIAPLAGGFTKFPCVHHLAESGEESAIALVGDRMVLAFTGEFGSTPNPH